jgi:hypothetical protein
MQACTAGNLFNHSETAVSRLNGPPNLSLSYFLCMAYPCPIAHGEICEPVYAYHGGK